MRVLIVGSVSGSLVNFRYEMLKAMVAAGHEVIACAPAGMREGVEEAMAGIGVDYRPMALDRRGTSILADRRYYGELVNLIEQVQPDVVLSYTIKPVVYGSLAAAKCGVGRIAAMITGAGAAQPGTNLKERVVTWLVRRNMQPGTNLKERVVTWLVRRLYRRALRHAEVVFFQNPDDEAMFREAGMLGPGRVVRIAGSGVDIEHYTPTDPPREPVTFLLIARLLANKGIREYARAAEMVRARHGDAVRFILVGPSEQGDGGVSEAEVAQWQAEGVLEYRGRVDDVRPVMGEASVYVLPSYREGTPRTVLEAMAMGRAVITSDAPGCRETVEEGVNGLLVPVRDAEALAAAMERLIEQPELIEQMGRRGRERAEAVYDVRKVNEVILAELGLA